MSESFWNGLGCGCGATWGDRMVGTGYGRGCVCVCVWNAWGGVRCAVCGVQCAVCPVGVGGWLQFQSPSPHPIPFFPPRRPPDPGVIVIAFLVFFGVVALVFTILYCARRGEAGPNSKLMADREVTVDMAPLTVRCRTPLHPPVLFTVCGVKCV